MPDYPIRNLVDRLPSALEPDIVRSMLRGRSPAVFLDYDGTLTPIVAHPDLATLSAPMKASLERLAAVAPVAIVSGGAVVNAKEMIGIDGIFYAGSHGFDLIDPTGVRTVVPPASDYLCALDGAEAELKAKVGEIDNAWVERKRFAIAVQYRQTPDNQVARLDAIVAGVADGNDDLRRTEAKKIFELRPNIDWDKGQAVFAIMGSLGLDRADVCPIFVGDDVTDEDAFCALQGRGVGVFVEGAYERTFADLALPDTDAVGDFLDELTALTGGDEGDGDRGLGRDMETST